MPDHVHALLTVREDSTIADFLKVWKKTSSYRIGRFYEQELTKYRELCPQECPIWQARYYDFLVESDEKLPEKIQYMHDNPVVARLAETEVDWKWSSSRFYELEEDVGVKITPIR
jgi:REP element-mobilizing transposase RayT